MRRFRELVKVLRLELPAAYPVSVKRVPMADMGTCERKGNQFIIRIRRSLGEEAAMEALVHEYGHALAWNAMLDVAPPNRFHTINHGPEWGVAYAEVYRLYEKRFLD